MSPVPYLAVKRRAVDCPGEGVAMMTIRSILVVAACAMVLACEHAGPSGLYFGQTPPGSAPTAFAPRIISKEGRFEQFLLYAPDGDELIFGVTNEDWSAFTLHSMRLTDEGWTEPMPPAFTGDNPGGLTACWSFDGDRAFFTDARPIYPPANIFMSVRDETGWSEPITMESPINSDSDEWEVACTRSGTLYFSSARRGGYGQMDIYRAPLVNGGYPRADNLGPAINTSAIDDLPYVSPDESYLVFGSDREGGYGNHDLYISYQIDGAWSEPQNLGPVINSEQFDNYPSVSPDGEYLFFTRRAAWAAEEDSDVYWVSTEFVGRMRATARAYDGPTGPPPTPEDEPPPLGLLAQLTSPDHLDVQGTVGATDALGARL